jgi:hypothetical protein
MTPEYKIILENLLKETDWSVLPDVNLNYSSRDNFVVFRNLVRNELLENTSNFTSETIPQPPTAVWM